MSTDNDFPDDDEFEDEEQEEGGDGEEAAAATEPGGIGNWLRGKRGWLAVIGITLVQAVFAVVMILMRSDAKPVAEVEAQTIQALAADMLGHEVEIKQIYQLLPAPGGKRMTVGLDIVLVLGQLPEERVEGSPRPTNEELALFMSAIRAMEPRIRSRVNSILQQIPIDEYGRVQVLAAVKEDIRNYINDGLEGLDFGKPLRPDIGKRRVTEVLLPMFVRQMM